MKKLGCAVLMLVMLTIASMAQQSQVQIKSIAGTGQAGYSGDAGQAAKAQLNNPFGVIVGADGAIYFCDTMNHVVRRIDRKGLITTVAGSGKKGYSGDGGAATKAEMNEPYEIRFDRGGNLFIVERMNHVVRRVDRRTQIITTIAGTGQLGFSGDGGVATKATMNQPHSIQFGQFGNKDDLFICDILNHRIRKVDMKTGVISTFAGTGEKKPTPDGAKIAGTPLNGPRAIDFDRQGNLWLALREGNAVYKLDMKGETIHHIAGTGKQGFTGNGGAAKLATLSGPKGLSIAPNGNVYLADTESHSIRMIDLKTMTIELVAGTGKKGDGADGDPLQCAMARPHGVFVGQNGKIFIGDSEAHRVRVIQIGQK
ncbi:MAG: hypothetical protein ACKVZH_04285 [Blastocatellia bacterium]